MPEQHKQVESHKTNFLFFANTDLFLQTVAISYIINVYNDSRKALIASIGTPPTLTGWVLIY